jgi:hypothetical protein
MRLELQDNTILWQSTGTTFLFRWTSLLYIPKTRTLICGCLLYWFRLFLSSNNRFRGYRGRFVLHESMFLDVFGKDLALTFSDPEFERSWLTLPLKSSIGSGTYLLIG